MSFPHLLKPRAIDAKSEPKYSVVMLFPDDADLKEMKQKAKEAAKEKFGSTKGIIMPFNDQGEKDLEGYEEGCICVTATSPQKVGVVDEDVSDVIDPSEIYPGRWAQATVVAFGWTYGKSKKGVSFGLRNIQLLDHDDNLGGGASASSDFGDDEEDDDDDDSFLD